MAANSRRGLTIDLRNEGRTQAVTLVDSNINYLYIDELIDVVRAAKRDSAIRLISISFNNVSDDADSKGALPARLSHRHPRGTHGPGPILEQELISELRACMKPTIAFLSGAIGNFAIDVVATCDVRVASSDLELQDMRVQQGRTAATGIAYLLPRLVGLSQAMRVMLLGESLDAEELKRIQFLHDTCKTEDFDAYIANWQERLSAMPTRAWEVHKMQVLAQLDLGFDAAMTHSLGIRQTHVIKDRVEGIQAWRERREPRFTGQ